MDALKKNGNASMPEQVKRPNPWKKKKKVMIFTILPIPEAARSKTWVCGRSLAEILNSNHAGGINVCLL